LEWHLRLVTAVRTNNGIHLARFTRTTVAAAVSPAGLPFTCRAARWTTAWSIRQIMTGVKFLLTNGEDEFLIAIAATQGLITQ
jgi:hypothetical protein